MVSQAPPSRIAVCSSTIDSRGVTRTRMRSRIASSAGSERHATTSPARASARAGRFREDLYYRLDVVSIELPPLRRRGDDVVDLAHHFLTKYARKHRKPVTRFEPNALDLMRAHSWPGNVRELENAVQRAVVLAVGDAVTAANLPAALTSAVEGPAAAAAADLPFTQARRSMLEAFEHRYVESVLRRSGGNAAEAARIAGLDRSNFRRLVRRHGLDLGRFRAGDDKRPS
jgi:DNA-binding NtrC family response regulator